MKKQSIFDKEMSDPKFKAVYNEIALKLGIGEQIAELRHKRNMTQLKLAKKAHSSRSAVARYESGNYNNYNIKTLAKIASALNADFKISLVEK
ncbi:MAG: helix-turn-helix protein [uncultured bacterium]|nr:MAG: helix-turn-helix protein [uncultured bacterium]